METAAWLCDAAVFVILIKIAWHDWRSYIIPHRYMALLAIAAAVGTAVGEMDLAAAAEGMLFGFFIYACLFYLKKGMIGAGDVKLAAVLGFWLGWPLSAAAVYLSFISGGIAAIFCLLLQIKKRSDMLPFAPLMAFSAAIVYICGEALWQFWQAAVCGI